MRTGEKGKRVGKGRGEEEEREEGKKERNRT